MQKRVLFLILFITIFVKSYSQVNILWATRYTSSGSNIDKAEDMVMDASGNVYVTGIGRGASGGFDYITIKYNSSGVEQWKAEYNGPGNGLDEAHAITIDASGNVYVTGWSNGGATPGFDYATVKYDATGTQQWVARYNNSANGTDEAWDIAVDNAGNVYVTGTSDGATVGNSAATTVKYNSAGAQQNVVRYEGSGNGIDAGYAIYVEPATGIVYVAGYTFRSTAADFDFLTLKYSTALAQQWVSRYNGPDGNYDEARAIAVDAAGNVYVTGYSQTTVLTNYNYSTVKYNSTGAQQWAMNYNGTGNDYDRANAIKLDAVGNVYVTGRSVGAGTDAEDIVTIKYSNNGTLRWTARYNGTTNGYDEGNAIDIDASGSIYVAGYSYSQLSNNDYIVLKYDSTGVGTNGTLQWIAKYNGTGNNTDQAVGIGVDAAGNVYVSGQSRGVGTNDDYATVKFCQFTASAGNDTSICSGSSVMLNGSGTGAVSYSWAPATGLSATNIANPIASPSDTTTYVVTITNGNNCVDYDTVVVNVVPLPAPGITANGPTTFCIGDSVTLTATLSNSYQWSTSETTQSIKVFASGTYTVTVANPTGCTGTASKAVTVNSLPLIDAGTDDTICIGSSVNLQATGGMGYVWHYGKTLSDSTIANPVATPTVTITYTVIGTANGCINQDTVKITVLPKPVIDAGLNNNVCSGSSVTIQASGGVSYIWSPGNTLSDSTIFNPVAQPSITTTYTVTGTGANGCKNTDIIKITVLSLPLVNAGLDDSICIGASINLQASGAVFYNWSPGSSLDDSTIFDPIANPVTTTTYTVVGTGTNGCTKMDAVEITVIPLPTINAGADNTVCTGGSVQLLVTGGLTYVWSPSGSLSNSTISNPMASPTITTTYTVVGTGPGGCSSNDKVKITVLPKPAIDAGVNDSVCQGSSVQLQASGGNAYSWSPSGSLSNSTVVNPMASPTSTTTYTVVGTSAAGCTNSDIVKITVLNNPSVPTVSRGKDTLYCDQAAAGYQWYLNGVLIPGATNQWYRYTQLGTYHVEIVDTYGCSASSAPVVVVGIEENEGFGSLLIYPNPATDIVTFEFNLTKADNIKISLMNMTGQLVFTDELNRFTGTYKKQLSLQENSNGIYYLQIITSDRIINKKIVKQ